LRTFVAIGVALVVVAVAGGTYWFGRSIGPTAAETASCRKATCGPLELLDCGAAFDGPLFVYVRFTGHYLGDCGHWSASIYSTNFCRAVGSATNLCTQP
jgi:hypothetical protein